MAHAVVLALAAVGALLCAAPAPAMAQAPAANGLGALQPRATLVATSADGTALAVQEWGDPAGPPVLFIHGFAQSHLSWAKQVTARELAGFRLITFDLRGHGQSAKPADRAAYQDAQRWADDVKAVLDATGARRPVLVAWSYGGRVAGDYLKVHGPGAIAGLNLVAAVTNAALNADAPANGAAAGMLSPALGPNVAATRDFMRQAFSKLPAVEEFEALLVATGMTPPEVRRNLVGRPTDYETVLKSLAIPVLVSHGDEDRAIKPDMSRWTAGVVPNASVSFYTGVGHSPFWEDPGRFNRELANLVRAAQFAR